MRFLTLSILGTTALGLQALAKQIVITVGGNTTDDAGAVFVPQTVVADQGDVVVFNFTQGNHTATQALFASPCIPAHFVDETINGFNSEFRNAGNFSAITTLPVVIDNPNVTIWFYDHNTCAEGGVGGINVNESSWETLDGFARNAVRLNGTSDQDTVPSTTATRPSTTSTSTSTSTSDNDATRAVKLGIAAVAPILAMAVAFL